MYNTSRGIIDKTYLHRLMDLWAYTLYTNVYEKRLIFF